MWGDVTSPASRARRPDRQGVVARDGVDLSYAVYGDGRPAVVLMPTWSIVNSRIWKAQIPYLARHFTVVTFDGRGSGSSGRPEGAAAYANEEYAADTVAVLDAAGVDRAVLVSFSCGAAWSVHVAAEHPGRVLGLFAIAPSCGFPIAFPDRESFAFSQRLATNRGWAKYNRYIWLEGDFDDWLRFFFGEMFNEPHSTKQIEDAIGWGRDIAPQTLVDTVAGRLGLDGSVCVPLEPLCEQVKCPVTVLGGVDDQVTPFAVGERLAELTGGSVVRIEGGGHGPLARDPVLVNHEIRRFVESLWPAPARRTRVRSNRRAKRALYVSSPIGLGHAARDVAIADELRRLHPSLEIDWLAQHPVTTVLERRAEHIHPASDFLANESAHIEEEAGEHDLHAFQAIRRMDEILVSNFMVFADLIEDEHYDLVIGDEAWDIDYFLHENPELKRSAYAWFTDFVGWLPMPDGGEREQALTADYNAQMIEHRARFRRLRDRSIFVGSPGDIVDDTFGPGLPEIREWTTENFDFSGYVTGFDPTSLGDRAELRERLGYHRDERVCLVTVGGSGVGAALLRRVIDAIPQARRLVPGLRFVVVTGPRIDPRSLPSRAGLSVTGYLPDLYQHLAACDVALVQGGLTTCMELTATRTPFIYVPLQHHFEQNFHVRRRLDQYRAGTCLSYQQAADPDLLAPAIAAELARPVDYAPVETDGAARAAGLLAELL